jgi:hypothetical protein
MAQIVATDTHAGRLTMKARRGSAFEERCELGSRGLRGILTKCPSRAPQDDTERKASGGALMTCHVNAFGLLLNSVPRPFDLPVPSCLLPHELTSAR